MVGQDLPGWGITACYRPGLPLPREVSHWALQGGCNSPLLVAVFDLFSGPSCLRCSPKKKDFPGSLSLFIRLSAHFLHSWLLRVSSPDVSAFWLLRALVLTICSVPLPSGPALAQGLPALYPVSTLDHGNDRPCQRQDS